MGAQINHNAAVMSSTAYTDLVKFFMARGTTMLHADLWGPRFDLANTAHVIEIMDGALIDGQRFDAESQLPHLTAAAAAEARRLGAVGTPIHAGNYDDTGMGRILMALDREIRRPETEKLAATITITELGGDEQIWGPALYEPEHMESAVDLAVRANFGRHARFVPDGGLTELQTDRRLYGQIGVPAQGGQALNMITGRIRIDIERDA